MFDLHHFSVTNDELIHRLPLGVVVIGPDAHIRLWNPTMIDYTGLESHEALGHGLREALSGWKQVPSYEQIIAELSGHRFIEKEISKPGQGTGVSKAFRAKFCPIKGLDADKPVGVLCIFLDITEMLELEKQLVHCESLASVGRLSAGVAHELNNPLDGTIRYINLALDQSGEEGLVREFLLHAKEGLTRMTKIVRDLLEFSRFAGTSGIRVSDINNAIEGALLLLNHRVLYQNIQVIKKLKKGPLPVCDYGLEQVFLNIFKNAFDSMPNGGQLKITSDVADDMVQIIIQDSGSGIPVEIGEKVFEPFFSTKAIGKGTGLGLSIASEVIHKSQGFIDFDSEKGKGTTFKIAIPSYKPADAENK